MNKIQRNVNKIVTYRFRKYGPYGDMVKLSKRHDFILFCMRAAAFKTKFKR